MAYDLREDRLDLGMHWELSKYLYIYGLVHLRKYKYIYGLDVWITEVYGSRDVDTIFMENKFCGWRLICEIHEIYGLQNISALRFGVEVSL